MEQRQNPSSSSTPSGIGVDDFTMVASPPDDPRLNRTMTFPNIFSPEYLREHTTWTSNGKSPPPPSPTFMATHDGSSDTAFPIYPPSPQAWESVELLEGQLLYAIRLQTQQQQLENLAASNLAIYQQHNNGQFRIDEPRIFPPYPHIGAEPSPYFPGEAKTKLSQTKDGLFVHDTVSKIANLNGRYEHWVKAYVNDIKIIAFPDNCSGLNIISEAFAKQNKFAINRTKVPTIRLPNKDILQSSGFVKLKLRFDGETTVFDLVFIVLPRCVCNIILGSDFLQSTKTFTVFKSRICRWFTPSIRPRPRVCLQGSPGQQVIGSINGHPASASPDTGSDVNVVSKDYAESIGLKIDLDPDAMETLEFIDGSSMATYGIVHNVEWKFGAVLDRSVSSGQPRGSFRGEAGDAQDWEYGSDARPSSTFLCNFYVLERLSCPIILSADLLYGTNAFIACAEYFYEKNEISRKRKMEDTDVCVIKKRPKSMKETFNKIFSKKEEKTTSHSVNHPPIVCEDIHAETRRRMRELDRIKALPLHEQPAAIQVEELRKQQWTQNNATLSFQPTCQQPASQ